MEKDKIARIKVIVIGGSAGSLDVILRILPSLKKGFGPAIVIVLHRKSTNDSVLTELLASRTILPVKEIEDKEPLVAGTVYIAPPDYHLLFEKNDVFSLDDSEKINFSRPSIDVSFESAVEAYSGSLACILLSGANSDGAEGLKTVKNGGGFTVVQDPRSAEVAFMPEQAILLSMPHVILDTPGIVALISEFGKAHN